MIKPAMIAALAILTLSACGQPAQPAAAPAVETVAAEPAAIEEAPAQAAPAPAPAAPVATLADAVSWPATTLRARIVTSKGDMLVELYPNEAPKTVANFVQYAKDGHYDRLIIHRVVQGFVIQGGGYNKYWNERPTRDPVPYEGASGLKNYRTTIAMARTPDPDSAASQWFINLRDNNGKLDHFVNDLGPRYGYAVFGRVTEGMDVADAIGAMRTGPGGPFPSEVPVETVTISRIDIIES
jgi:peptidyl-prolyl cis-trans isomerase A (cyclophilin A)/peptidyl-prolyl cis-trans isomerase B (cyclophilin B)